MLGECVSEFLVVGLADVADSLQTAPLGGILSVANVLDQSRHKLRPLLTGQFDGGNSSNKLCGRVPSSCVVACKCLKGVTLDLRLDLRSEPLLPSCLNLAQASEVTSGERVLERKTGCYTDL